METFASKEDQIIIAFLATERMNNTAIIKKAFQVNNTGYSKVWQVAGHKTMAFKLFECPYSCILQNGIK